MNTVVYPGSFDPATYGHLTVIENCAKDYGHVVVAIGINPRKNYMFSLAERETLVRQAVASKRIKNVSVVPFKNMLVNFMVRNGYDVIVRGLRSTKDFEEAAKQDAIGRLERPKAESIRHYYVPTFAEMGFVSSSDLKEIMKSQGDVSLFAPPSTIHATQARQEGKYFYGITGVSGAGKTSICERFVNVARERGITLYHLDLDQVTRKIYAQETDEVYENARHEIEKAFGPGIVNAEGFIDDKGRMELGQIVFNDPEKLKVLNGIVHDAVFFYLNDFFSGDERDNKKGLFLIDAALLAETNKTLLVNNHVLVVDADQETLADRLNNRDNLTPEQVERRLSSQFTAKAKLATICNKIRETAYGNVNYLKNDGLLSDRDVVKAFDTLLECVDIYGELRIASFLKQIGVAKANEAYASIRGFYAGDNRFYHALSHVVDGLNQMPEFLNNIQDKDAFTLAWLFHDAVYNPLETNNEEKSAALLERMGKEWGLDERLVVQAKNLILMTRHGQATPETSDEKFFVDLDMSILGRSVDEFDRYETSIRREYSSVSPAVWCEGRRQFLSELKPPFFHTDYFAGKYSESTRGNINHSLAKLAYVPR